MYMPTIASVVQRHRKNLARHLAPLRPGNTKITGLACWQWPRIFLPGHATIEREGVVPDYIDGIRVTGAVRPTISWVCRH